MSERVSRTSEVSDRRRPGRWLARGAIELLPGIALLPFDGEMSAIYDLPETQPAWVDVGAEAPFRMKFGVDYLSASGD